MKNTKKGFTLVELLFVMAIIAILAGFAIANLKDSTNVAQKNSMKNDLKNLISTQNTNFAKEQAYLTCNSSAQHNAQGTVECEDSNGNIITNGATESKNNVIFTEQIDCGDGTIGFRANVYGGENSPVQGTEYNYNSCTDGTIIEN